MRIALINENSQAAKNELIFGVLDKVAKKYGHEAINFGMFGADDEHQLTYVKNGLLAAVLLNSGAVDFVVTGCGTGQGAMLALNSFSNVLCGFVSSKADGFMFRQINDGNAVSLAYAKGFGWGAELDLEDIFEGLFSCDGGNGYPKERAVPEKQNKLVLDQVKTVTHNDFVDVLNNLDEDFVKSTLDYQFFKENYFKLSKNDEIDAVIKRILEK